MSDIMRDKQGEPILSSTVALEDLPDGEKLAYALFMWQTKDGRKLSAAYPHLAFYE